MCAITGWQVGGDIVDKLMCAGNGRRKALMFVIVDAGLPGTWATGGETGGVMIIEEGTDTLRR